MPDVWSHIILGNAMLQGAPPAMQAAIAEQDNLYAFACQGPDFLFYHTYLCPWEQKSTTVGRRIHKQKFSAMLLCGIKKVGQLKNSGKNWQTLAVYMLGAAAHWAADSAIHPLIYSIVPEKSPFRKSRHKRVEMGLDLLLLKKYGITRSSRAERLRLRRSVPEEVCDYYGKCVTTLWRDMPYLSPTEIRRSYRHLIQFLAVTDEKNTAYQIAQALVKASNDFLHFDWFWYQEQLPPEEQIPLEASMDVFTAKAIARGKQVQAAMWRYWQGESPLSSVKEAIPEISYANRNMTL